MSKRWRLQRFTCVMYDGADYDLLTPRKQGKLYEPKSIQLLTLGKRNGRKIGKFIRKENRTQNTGLTNIPS